jgi:hypothetical protein
MPSGESREGTGRGGGPHDKVNFVTFEPSGQKRTAFANRSTARETAFPGAVYSTGQVRDLPWTRPFNAVSRLSRESRRSQGSLQQHVSGPGVGSK